MSKVFFVCAVVLAVFSAAWAYEVFEPVQDSFIMYIWDHGEEFGIDENYGDSTELWVRVYGHPGEYIEFEDAVVQFDLSDVDPAMNVFRAYLYLDISYRGMKWEFYEIEEEWSEMEITWSNAPSDGECFFEYRFSDGVPPYFELPADYVQGWVDYPSENFGFRIKEEADFSVFDSRESDTPPRLDVWFETDDTESPACEEVFPVDGEGEVPPDSSIEFNLTDDLAGIDTDTIQFTLDLQEERATANRGCLSTGNTANTPIEGTLEIDDENPLEVACVFTPTDDLPWGAYTCTVDGSLADLLGKQMGEDYVWSFDTRGWDEDPPEVTDLTPGDGDEDIPPDSVITFHLTDGYAGVDVSTLAFSVRENLRQPASLDKAKALPVCPSPVGEIEGELEVDSSDLFDVGCTFTPSDDLPPGPITCTVAGSLADRDGNALGDDFVWTFSVGGSVEDEHTWGEIKAAFE
ncbi:MAG: DNRLRE domain-containing protein [bacterium]|nr:DNRLRE domain-containing protein [bacterium]